MKDGLIDSYIGGGDAYLLQIVAIYFNHTVNACSGNMHTFGAVLKVSLTLFWSISSKYSTVSILGSYLFFWGSFIISYYHKWEFGPTWLTLA